MGSGVYGAQGKKPRKKARPSLADIAFIYRCSAISHTRVRSLLKKVRNIIENNSRVSACAFIDCDFHESKVVQKRVIAIIAGYAKQN